MAKTIENLKQFLQQEGFTKYSLCEDNDNFVLNALKHDENGTYVFVVRENFSRQYEKFMREVTGHFRNAQNEEREDTMLLVPDFNGKIDDNDKMCFSEGSVFYVGSAKNVKGRIKEHITNATLSKTGSLKLGFETRSRVKTHLDIYVRCYKTIGEARDMEGYIRTQFGAYFGE